jgi:hypothetical protein
VRRSWHGRRRFSRPRWPSGTSPQGHGGVPGRRPVTYGPDLILRQLEKLAGRFLEFQKDAWSKVKASEWRLLGKGATEQERGRLRQLLADTLNALAEVATGCEQARATLVKLLERLG